MRTILLCLAIFAGININVMAKGKAPAQLSHHKDGYTIYAVKGLGSVSIPAFLYGIDYNPSSHRILLTDADTTIYVSVLIAPSKVYDFNKDGSLKGMDFIESFIDWIRQDGEFHKLNLQLIANEPDKNLMIIKCPSNKRYKDEFVADNKYDTISITQPNQFKGDKILADDYYVFHETQGVFLKLEISLNPFSRQNEIDKFLKRIRFNVNK